MCSKARAFRCKYVCVYVLTRQHLEPDESEPNALMRVVVVRVVVVVVGVVVRIVLLNAESLAACARWMRW